VVAEVPPVAPLAGPARGLGLDGALNAYPTTVGQAVDYAIYMGFYEAVGKLAGDVSGDSGVTYNPMSETRPKGMLLTFFFTGNVDGEREDCGCKKNPMGGLTRKAHLVTSASKAAHPLEQPDGLAVVDAGNLLFASSSVRKLGDKQQQAALLQAEAIVESFNVIGCDAFGVGQNDVAMGVEALGKLRRKATFPFVSANLRARGGKALMFEPFVVREVGDRKVAFVGLTDPEAPEGYFAERGVEVLEPKAALEAQAPRMKAAGADMVVLLSNLGVTRTQALIDGLDLAATPVHVAAVSGTRRSTYQPLWTRNAVPLVESGSRGKYLGRLDLHVLNGEVRFDPGKKGHTKAAGQYLSAYRSLHSARRALAQAGQDHVDATREERYRRNLDFAVKRLRTIEDGLPSDVSLTNAAPAPTNWLRVSIAPLPIELPQDERVRAILDRYQQRVEQLIGPTPQGGH